MSLKNSTIGHNDNAHTIRDNMKNAGNKGRATLRHRPCDHPSEHSNPSVTKYRPDKRDRSRSAAENTTRLNITVGREGQYKDFKSNEILHNIFKQAALYLNRPEPDLYTRLFTNDIYQSSILHPPRH
jgi:hypothetical protein